MSNSDLGTYEMLWDCEFCGTTKLLGLTHRFCPNCGATQNPAKRYFPADAEKVAVKDHQYVGVDVICPSCQTPSSATSEFCGNCGTPLTDAAKASLVTDAAAKVGGKFQEGKARDLVKENFEADMARTKKPTSLSSYLTGKVIAAIVGFIFFCCGGCGISGYFLTITEDHTVEAVAHSWEREIQVMTFTTVEEEDWEDDVPNGAENVSCTRKQNGTRKIPDGETCTTRRIDNGDGTFRERRECTTDYREEPVYDDYCDYKIDKWVVTNTLETSGDSFSESPAWPALNFTQTGDDCLGCQKEGDKNEKYVVTFRDLEDGKTYECEYDRENEWRTYPPGTQWTAKVTKYGGVIECDTLKAG